MNHCSSCPTTYILVLYPRPLPQGQQICLVNGQLVLVRAQQDYPVQQTPPFVPYPFPPTPTAPIQPERVHLVQQRQGYPTQPRPDVSGISFSTGSCLVPSAPAQPERMERIPLNATQQPYSNCLPRHFPSNNYPQRYTPPQTYPDVPFPTYNLPIPATHRHQNSQQRTKPSVAKPHGQRDKRMKKQALDITNLQTPPSVIPKRTQSAPPRYHRITETTKSLTLSTKFLQSLPR